LLAAQARARLDQDAADTAGNLGASGEQVRGAARRPGAARGTHRRRTRAAGGVAGGGAEGKGQEVGRVQPHTRSGANSTATSPRSALPAWRRRASARSAR